MLQTCGKLFIVATPIGNLQDISQRALTVLADVELIAAEDTRHSQKLLQQFQITTSMLSLHDHNEQQRAQQLIKRLQQGQNIALISDAGTPLISDPGYGLVNQCRQHDIQVIPIPGACAAIAALSASGLATDRFVFEGFLPVKEQARRQAIEQLLGQTSTTVFYEAPRRVVSTLQMMAELLPGDHQLVLAKELTKAFENFISGTASQLLAWLQAEPVRQKGEFVLMVAGCPHDPSSISQPALALLRELMAVLPLKKAAAITASHYDLKKNDLYKIGLEMSE